MNANNTQVGGNHYQREYQHWDFTTDLSMPYLIGCATKYISRWQYKNGIEDLNKSLHYIKKCGERDIYLKLDYEGRDVLFIDKYCDQFSLFESSAIRAICNGQYNEANIILNELIEELESGPSANNVDPDNNYIRG